MLKEKQGVVHNDGDNKMADHVTQQRRWFWQCPCCLQAKKKLQ